MVWWLNTTCCFPATITMKTLLICHNDAELEFDGLARWMSSWSDLCGIIRLTEKPGRKWKRIRREVKRVGPLRFLDVLAFRLWYRLARAKQDQAWEQAQLTTLREKFDDVSDNVPVLETHSPNSPEAEEFIRQHAPSVMIARCKTLLAERIFSIPSTGTFVMHPGMCPEYRNAHGCFWALARDDVNRVAMTLLKVDQGIDTGNVFGYFHCDFDELNESHHVIQDRTVLDNLDAIAERFQSIEAGDATPIDTSGRESATWGQPWLTRQIYWTIRARQRKQNCARQQTHQLADVS